MTPPKARQAGQDAEAAVLPSAALLCAAPGQNHPELARRPQMQVLQKRADFLRAAKAARAPTPNFLLQARHRAPDEQAAGARVGFTCTRKVGNAVVRNRAKRRLRALARLVLTDMGQCGWDYVLVGRPGATVSADFATMQADLYKALARVHAPARRTASDGPQ